MTPAALRMALFGILPGWRFALRPARGSVENCLFDNFRAELRDLAGPAELTPSALHMTFFATLPGRGLHWDPLRVPWGTANLTPVPRCIPRSRRACLFDPFRVAHGMMCYPAWFGALHWDPLGSPVGTPISTPSALHFAFSQGLPI